MDSKLILAYVPELRIMYDILLESKDVIQDKKWHPEGSVWNHSIQSFFNTYRESLDLDLILAALFHDIGKIIDRKEHTYWSLFLLKNKVSAKTEWLIYQHMRMHMFFDGRMVNNNKVQSLISHPWFIDACHLARIDTMSRKEREKEEELSYWRLEEMLLSLVARRFQMNQRRKKNDM